ncbi:MAG: ABC transporter permease subunit [Agathobacter sp.]|nr:ABC transporter permease subunit [Agathobacter sp.]
MTLIKHELRQGWKSLAIWTLSIGFFIVICVMMYPEMEGEMEEVSEMFSSMGAFTAAFGMDKLNFGTLIGFYAIECGNILGIGGAFFAAILGITALAKEEKERTAEFLLSHPVSRNKVITEKLIAVFLQIVIMNVLVYLMSIASIAGIGEEISWEELGLLHLAYFLVQIVLAGICFGISAFIRGNGIGAGIGLATVMYFINIVANITESAKDLKYLTPFGFAEGADIITNVDLEWKMVAINMVFAFIAVGMAYWKYAKKDIR